MQEIWKDVNGYEGLYQVSNLGRVESLQRDVNLILKPRLRRDGYLIVSLSKNGKVKSKPIHRLVATAFIPNPDNKKTVNHKDGNKLNNHVTNLEWNTSSENNKHAYNIGIKIGSMTGKFGNEHNRSTKINQYNKIGVFINSFGSSHEIKRKLNINPSHVISVCKGKRKTAGGFIWKYAEENK